MPIAYSPDALVFDAVAKSWSLRPDYDPHLHRVDIQVANEEPGYNQTCSEHASDTHQHGAVYDLHGSLIASGQVRNGVYQAIHDGGTSRIYLERVEVGGVHAGYAVNMPLDPGVTYSEPACTEPAAFGDSHQSDVPCFAPDTRILTDAGEIPVQWLNPGDRVMTRDDGPVALRWLGRYPVAREMLHSAARLRPVCIAPDPDAKNAPHRPLWLSQQHKVLVTGPDLRERFDIDEAFVPAKAMALPALPERLGPVFTYHHLLFDAHHVICANGCWTESLYAGARTDAIAKATGVTPPSDICHDAMARPCLSTWEARMLLGGRGRHTG